MVSGFSAWEFNAPPWPTLGVESVQCGLAVVRNCHPISLLSLVSKDLERIVDNALMAHVIEHGWFLGFQPGSSTQEAVLTATRSWHEVLERQKSVGCVFFRDHWQRVVLDGVTSGRVSVQSGVPQGSILGPLLFISVDSLLLQSFSLGTSLCMFADDIALYKALTHPELFRLTSPWLSIGQRAGIYA